MRFIVRPVPHSVFFLFSTWLTCDFVIFVSLQASVQDVLWRSVSPDATTLPENEWFPQQLLGLGRRGRRYWSQVRIISERCSQGSKCLKWERCVCSLSFCSGCDVQISWLLYILEQTRRVFEDKCTSRSLKPFCYWHFNVSDTLCVTFVLRPLQSLSGWDVHHSSVTEGGPLQDDQTQAGQRQWCEPKEVQWTKWSHFSLSAS